MGKFDDRVAIVTGGGQGLGRAICLKLSSEGATVAVADIKEETANETVQLIKDQGGNAFFVDDAEGYVRLNLAMPRAQVEKGLRRMRDAIREHNSFES